MQLDEGRSRKEHEEAFFNRLCVCRETAAGEDRHFAEGLGKLDNVEHLLFSFRRELIHLDASPHRDIEAGCLFPIDKKHFTPLHSPESGDAGKALQMPGG